MGARRRGQGPIQDAAGARWRAVRADGALSVGLYATAEQVRAELAGHDDLDLPDDVALDALVEEAQREVDRRLGPLLTSASTGLKLTPLLLASSQRAALTRAVAVAVGHAVLLDTEQAFGVGDWLPQGFTPLPGIGSGSIIDAQLAGHGLIARSGCAAPDPEPLLDDIPF